MDERRLIERVLAGDASAERTLYDAHVDRVYRLAFRLAGDDDFARDITQETFIRAFQRLDRFRGDAALATWLHAITVSVALNGLRRRKRIHSHEVDLEHASLIGEPPSVSEPDVRERLKKAIGALPEIYRVVFIMHDIEGYTHEEIGAALELATGSSKARLSRARAKLRDSLAELAPEFAS